MRELFFILIEFLEVILNILYTPITWFQKEKKWLEIEILYKKEE